MGLLYLYLTFLHIIYNLLHVTVALGYDSLQFSDVLDTWWTNRQYYLKFSSINSRHCGIDEMQSNYNCEDSGLLRYDTVSLSARSNYQDDTMSLGGRFPTLSEKRRVSFFREYEILSTRISRNNSVRMSNVPVNRAKFVFITAVTIRLIFCNFALYRMVKLLTFRRNTVLPSSGSLFRYLFLFSSLNSARFQNS
jgi:hypothetical protein